MRRHYACLDQAKMIGRQSMKRWRRASVVLTALTVVVLAGCDSTTATSQPASGPAGPGSAGFTATPVVDLMRSENPNAYRVNVNKPDGLTGNVFYTVGGSAAVDLR